MIAHSGKCAKRITSIRGMEHCHRAFKQLYLGTMWCLSIAFDQSVGLPFDVVVIQDSEVISWASNQTAKHGSSIEDSGGVEVWTLLSTNAYGKRNKVPQEFVPHGIFKKVAAELLDAFRKAVASHRRDPLLPKLMYQHCQLWGGGRPQNALDESGMVFDPRVRAGACGDWCVSPCFEGAALSGMRLAEVIADHRSGSKRDVPHYQGDLSFHRIESACEIAVFPGWLDPETRLRGCPASWSSPTTCPDPPHPLHPVTAHGSPSVAHTKRWNRRSTATARVALPSAMAESDCPNGSHGESDSRNPMIEGPVRGRRRRWRHVAEEATTTQCTEAHSCVSAAEAEDVGRLIWSPAAETPVELQPGLVLLRGLVSHAAQQWLASETMRIGGTHVDQRFGKACSGGFYRASAHGGWELNVAAEYRGSFMRRFVDLHPYFVELCEHYFEAARAHSPSLPALDAQACVFNYYLEESPGIRWHVDIDETRDRRHVGQGRPVVSISLGDDCDFEYRCAHTHDSGAVHSVRLQSGDVLVFGGPSRGIPHAVTRIHPGTRGGGLRMPPGRLNLTCRHHA